MAHENEDAHALAHKKSQSVVDHARMVNKLQTQSVLKAGGELPSLTTLFHNLQRNNRCG